MFALSSLSIPRSVSALTVLAASLSSTLAFAEVQANQVLGTYAEIAAHNYDDALEDAKALQSAITAFTESPTAETLDQAKAAWLASRESYGQTEIFRLSEGPIDAEEGWVAEAYGALEGQLNAWPLDEHMIDYTLDADGNKTAGNIIDSQGAFTPASADDSAEAVDVSTISVEAITALNENGGEANVSSGYHAVEFLLWGQDQDYANFTADSVTNGALVAGQRPLSDFTDDVHAARRLAYLQAAAEKIVTDLSSVAQAWDATVDGEAGLYRAAFLGTLDGDDADKNLDHAAALQQVLVGMGMFLKSELANERIAVAVLTPSEEDEHSCFSDNTHRDIATNYQGFKNILTGSYKGESVGPALIDALSADDRAAVEALMADIEARIAKVNELAETEMHFDTQIFPSNEASVQNIVTLKNQLRKLGDKMVIVAQAFDVSINEDDVTDPEETQV